MKKFSLLLTIILLIFAACKKDDTIEDSRIKGCDPILQEPVRCNALLPPCDGSQKAKSTKCLANNTNGNRCGNNTLNVCGYCHIESHQNQSDGRCPLTTRNECEYCDEHLEHFQGK